MPSLQKAPLHQALAEDSHSESASRGSSYGEEGEEKWPLNGYAMDAEKE